MSFPGLRWLSLFLMIGLCSPCGLTLAEQQEWDLETASVEEIVGRLDELSQRKPYPVFKQLREFSTGPRIMRSVSLSADGKRMALLQGNGKIGVWNVAQGERVLEIEPRDFPHEGPLAISPDGAMVVFGNDFKDLEVYDTESGELLSVFEDLEAPISDLGFSPEGTRVFGINKKGTALIADPLQDNREITEDPQAEGETKYHMAMLGEDSWVKLSDSQSLRFQWKVDGEEGSSENRRLNPPTLVGGIGQYMTLIGNLMRVGPRDLTQTQEVYSHQWQTGGRVSSDGRSIWITSWTGVDIRQWDHLAFGTYAKLPVKWDLSYHWMVAPDAGIVVTHQNTGKTTVYQLEGATRSAVYEVVSAVDRLWEAQRYDAIMALAEQWKDRVDSPMDWDNSTAYVNVLNRIQSYQHRARNKQQRLAEMLEVLEKHPESPIFRIAAFDLASPHATYRPGIDREGEVKEALDRAFKEQANKAWEILEPLLEQDEIPPEAYVAIIRAARNLEWEEERLAPYLEKAEATAPRYHRIWTELAILRHPHWGGSPEGVEPEIAKVCDTIGGKEGDVVYAHVARTMRTYNGWQGLFEILGFDHERVLRGLIQQVRESNEAIAANMALFIAQVTDDRKSANELAQLIVERGIGYDVRLWNHQPANYEAALTWALTAED